MPSLDKDLWGFVSLIILALTNLAYHLGLAKDWSPWECAVAQPNLTYHTSISRISGFLVIVASFLRPNIMFTSDTRCAFWNKSRRPHSLSTTRPSNVAAGATSRLGIALTHRKLNSYLRNLCSFWIAQAIRPCRSVDEKFVHDRNPEISAATREALKDGAIQVRITNN